jgi:hypothetical protein
MRSRQSGQAAVETAIVMPLFVFTVLGIMQLSLLHHARLLTKYAAYKAARAGALNRASKKTMERAAISVMLPMITRENPIAAGSGGTQPQYGLYKISSPTEFTQAFRDVSQSRDNKSAARSVGDSGDSYTDKATKQLVQVTVCHPLTSDLQPDQDFDDPRTNPSGDWRQFENTKLSVQVTMYLHLIVPFANAFLWYASLGDIDQQRADTMKTLRMEHDKSSNDLRKKINETYTLDELRAEAQRGSYIIPVRASYSYRMHSNLSPDANLPSKNLCHVPFKKQ